MQFIKDFHSSRRKGLTDAEFMTAYFAYRAPIKVEQLGFEAVGEVKHFNMQAKIFDSEEKIHFIAQPDDTATTALHRWLSNRFGDFKIQSYRSESKEPGKRAAAHAAISIQADGDFFQGQASDHDIESAALKALIDACNQWQIKQHYALDKQPTQHAAIGLRD